MDSTKKQPQFLSRSLTYHHPNPNPKKPLFKNRADDDVNTSQSKSKSKLSSDTSSLTSAVLYVTSLRSIRRTFEDCSYIRSILRGFHVSVDERDVAVDSSFLLELQSLLKTRAFTLPPEPFLYKTTIINVRRPQRFLPRTKLSREFLCGTLLNKLL